MGKGSRQQGGASKTHARACAPLDPEAPAGAAFAPIQRALLATLRHNEAGVLADRDVEPLHDFRVALRRSRVLHRCFRSQLEGSGFEPLEPELRRLGRVTSPVRDLDVQLASLAGSLHEPSESAAGASLVELLLERRRAARAQLVDALSSPEYADFVARAERLLSSPDSEAVARMATTGPPLRPWASRRIARAHRRLLEHAREVDPHSPDTALHAVRIDAKKLRYLLEFFRGLYRPRAVAKRIHEVERLQDHLGRLNDACVQQRTLHALARDLAARDGDATESLLAAGRLIERADRRRRKQRRQFERRFARFEARAIQRRFERLFGDD